MLVCSALSWLLQRVAASAFVVAELLIEQPFGDHQPPFASPSRVSTMESSISSYLSSSTPLNCDNDHQELFWSVSIRGSGVPF